MLPFAPFYEAFTHAARVGQKVGARVTATYEPSGQTITGVTVFPSQGDVSRAAQEQFPLSKVLIIEGVPAVRPLDTLDETAATARTYVVRAVEPLAVGRYCRLLLEDRTGQV